MFKGSGVALITPMKSDGAIDEEAFIQLIEWHIEKGTASIIVAGTTGESSTLSDGEHMRVIDLAVQTVAGRIPVIAGTGSNETEYALWLSQKACELGVDGLLVINPYYNKANESGMIAHFEKIADNVNKPVILYNVPGRTGQSIPLGVALRLAQHPNIVGYKEASGDVEYLTAFASKMPAGFHLYSGNDDQVLTTLALGGSGVISVAANIIPSEMQELVMSFLEGDVAKSRALQFKYLEFIHLLFCEVSPVPIKEAMNAAGFKAGICRLPLGPMNDVNREALQMKMQEIGLEVN